jgi:multidrug efflux pump
VIYAAIAGVVALVYTRLPTSFLPQEDQGNILVNVQLPPGRHASSARAAVMEQVEAFILKQPEVQSMVGVLGFSFSGQGQNAALAFVTLKDWHERQGEEHSARRRRGARLRGPVAHPRCLHLPPEPAAHPRTGRGLGFTFRLQDRGGNGHEAWSPPATSCWGWPRRARCWHRCAPTAWKTRRSCRWTSTATRRRRWA